MSMTGDGITPKAGPLRRRLQYQTFTPTGRGARGKPEGSWSTVATVWAAVRQIAGREAVNAARLQIAATHTINTRYFGPASEQGRFLMGSRVFNVVTVTNVEERNAAYEFMAVEVRNPPQ